MSSGEEVFVVRACEVRDIPVITQIYGREVAEGLATFEIEAPDEAEMAARRERLVAGGYPYLVAVAGDRVVGYAYAGPYRPRPAYRGTVEDSVYLQPDWQGRGIGKRLLEELIAGAETRGFRQMVAVIGDSGNRGSIRLHERMGFRMVGTLEAVGWKHGRWVDTVLMQRGLQGMRDKG